jgi:RND family efflux transporter MFP subunit
MFSVRTVVIQMHTRITQLISLAAAAAIVSGCAARASQQTQPLGVAVERPMAPQSVALYEGPGSVSAAHTYRLSFEIPGKVASVNYDVGDRVPSGAVLAALDSSSYAAQAAAASAQSRSAPNAARAQLDRARAGAALAHVNYIRAVELFSQGAISAQARDAALAAERDAQAQVDSAQAQVTQSAAAVANADAAQITLGKTVLTSPADALVQQRSIEPGDTASPGTTVFTLISAATPDVLISVPERVRAEIGVGTPVLIVAGSRTFHGTVLRVEPAADEFSRTAQARVRIKDLSLPVGTVVNVKLGLARQSGFSIPLGSVLRGLDGRSSVSLYDPASGTLASRAINVVSQDGERVIVTGVTSSDLVVTQGQYEAQPGDHVHVVQTP